MDLNLNPDQLRTLHSDLQKIYAEFHGADDFSDTVAVATGHDHLHDSVHDFAHKWNEKRPEMADGVQKLGQKLGMVIDGFTQTDTHLQGQMQQAISQMDQADAEAAAQQQAAGAPHGAKAV
jgi:uncharacterized phage infection (PIP) family protein YhgE